MIWVTLASMIIPLLLKLWDYLRAKQANGEPLTEREQRLTNKLNYVTAGIRGVSVQLGCKADGEPEPLRKVAGGPLKEVEISPLSMAQFIELQRLLKLGDAATESEWAKFEAWISGPQPCDTGDAN